MKKPEKMLVYNLFPLLAGKVTDWENHLSRAADMGFNWIFVNPIQRLGASGSLYSLADYMSINPSFVDEKSGKSPEEQVRETLTVAEGLGLRVMVDLVINHCAADSPLLREHPAWFVWEGQGRVAHPSADENGKKVVWYDLAKFDHRNSKDGEGLFRFFSDVVEYLVRLGFKGFRCDAAYQVPRRLWERLINDTKRRHPDVIFFAETLGCTPDLTARTARAGFDYIFNSAKWWDFYSHWLIEQYHLTREVSPSIAFPESHDTVRLCEELNGNIEGVKQRYLFSALFSAGVMMPIGYEFCFRKRLHVVNTRPSDWEETGIDLTSFIRKANQLKTAHAVFQEESPTEFLHCNNPQVLLMWKASVSTSEEALLILNKDIQNRQHFHCDNIYNLLQARAPLVDVSPEYVLDHVATPFHYELRPGQGIVLITTRDKVPED
ncbi:MAG: alpha-amylase family glycosyl hydrolase [Chloroflexota bacterium]